MRGFEDKYIKAKKIHLHWQRQKYSPGTLVSGNRKPMRIFAGVRCINSEKRVCLSIAPVAGSPCSSIVTSVRYMFLNITKKLQYSVVVVIGGDALCFFMPHNVYAYVYDH